MFFDRHGRTSGVRQLRQHSLPLSHFLGQQRISRKPVICVEISRGTVLNILRVGDEEKWESTSNALSGGVGGCNMLQHSANDGR